MKRMIASSVAAVAICAAAIAQPIEGDYVVSVDTTLTEDTTVTGTLTVESGVTLDLNGWTLSAAAVSGSGSIVDSLAGYTRLVSLETGEDYGYIDLGYKHDASTIVDFHVQFPSVPAKGGYYAYYGARNSVGAEGQTTRAFGGWLSNDTGTPRFRSSFGESAREYAGLAVATDTDYCLHFEKSGPCTVTLANGDVHTLATGVSDNNTLEGNDYLFAFNQKQNFSWGRPWAVPYPTALRVFWFKAYSGDTLIRDMVPVKRKSDGQLGMYNFADAGDRFYPARQYNGNGTFTAGATAAEGRLQIALSGDGAAIDFSSLSIGSGVVLSFSGEGALSSDLDATAFASVEVASGAVLDLAGHNLTVNAVAGEGTITDTVGTALSGYDRLDFIQSTGKQYVNTGYIHDNTTIVDMRIQFDNVTDQWNAFYGARYNYSGNLRGFSMWLNYAKFRRAFGGSAANIDSHTVATSNIYDIHLDKSGAGNCTATPVGGDEIVLGTGTQDNPFDVPDYLFAINQNSGSNINSGWTASYHTEAKLYSCKMYYGTTLARDFVPVKCGDDIGLLDLVEGKFYGSATSTKFKPGNTVATTAGGELRIAVAEGATVEISETALCGALKLVKTGAGTLVMSKAQGYAGGTEVQGGVLKSGAESACVFGVEAGEVAIGSAGIVDLNGNAYLATRGWTVAGGGAIFNGGADIAVSLAVSGVFAPVVTTGGFGVTLADGSTIDFTKWTGAFPVASPAVSFAADSTIYVKLTPETEYISELANAVDSETGAKGGYLLEWSVVPSGVAFLRHYASSAGKFRLSVEDGGLRVSRSEGMTLFIR